VLRSDDLRRDCIQVAKVRVGTCVIAVSATARISTHGKVAALGQVVHWLSRRLRKRADLYLTASQISALTTIERHGELRLGELGRLEQISKSTLTKLAPKLQAGGYIHPSVDPTDGRGFLVKLTDHGAMVLQAARSRQEAYLLRQFNALGAADQMALPAAVAPLEKLLAVKA
jgi:DNA-binding MarR family transcriptional regulator